MGWMSSPPPPPAPDYTKAAEATAASNQDAQTRADWSNRPTVVTPWGQESWQSSASVDPSTGQPITSWTQTQTLNPESQATLDAQMGVDKAKSQTALSQFGRVQDAMATPFDWGNMQAYGQAPQAGNVQGGNLQAGYLGSGPQLQGGNLQAGPQTQAGNLQAGNLDANPYMTQGAGQGILGGLNTSSLGAMPQADAAERQRIEQMMFDRMAPQHQQTQAALESKLSNMGLTRGSQQWNDEMQRMERSQADERFNAMEMGGQEMQRQFGMQMQGRQQGWDEMQGAGAFQNAAQAQGYGQGLQQNQQNFGMQSQAGAQNFDQQARAGSQNFDQQAQALQDNFNREQQAGTYNFDQGLKAADSNYNREAGAGAQNFSQQQSAGNQNFQQQLAAQNQNYSQGMSSANYANALRQQQIAEQMQQRTMPLNELNALLTGTQVGQLQTPDFAKSQSAGGTDYSGAANSQYNASMDAYNAQQASKQGVMSGIGGIASAGIMAF